MRCEEDRVSDQIFTCLIDIDWDSVNGFLPAISYITTSLSTRFDVADTGFHTCDTNLKENTMFNLSVSFSHFSQ